MLNPVGLSALQMVDFRTILQLVEFILCILYDGVALIVIPDCIEAIAFYAKIVTAAHIDVSEQIQGLKLVVIHILLALVIVKVTWIRFWIRTEEDLLQGRVGCKVLLLLRLATWWRFFFLLFLSVLSFWGMFVRVYPKIVQGLTFLNSVKHITTILARCTS